MPKIDPNQCRPGTKLVDGGHLWVVTDYQHRKPGKGPAFVVCKLKSLLDGHVVERTFRGSGDQPETAEVEQRMAQFLYNDDMGFHFMDLTTYDQFPLGEEFIGDRVHYLLPDAEVQIQYWNGSPIGIEIPLKMVFTVADTVEEVAKGNTSSSITKDAVLETGLTIQVPPFIKNGEKVLVNTETGEYIERA